MSKIIFVSSISFFFPFFFFVGGGSLLIYISYWAIGLISRVFANGPGVWDQSHVESYQRLKKWYLMLLCLTLHIIW